MIRTRVGYAGGTTSAPTYGNLGGHTETIQIDYDPAQISYGELLAVFWDAHDVGARPRSRQYRSMIFYHDATQERLALETKEREEARLGSEVFTQIIPFSEFSLAEDYHQKFYLRGVSELVEEISAIYPDTDDFINSTAAARVNGYVGGYGTLEGLKKHLSSLGLSPAGNSKLLEIADRGLIPGCAVSDS